MSRNIHHSLKTGPEDQDAELEIYITILRQDQRTRMLYQICQEIYHYLKTRPEDQDDQDAELNHEEILITL